MNGILSFHGRIGRSTWWVANIGIIVVYFVLGGIMGVFSSGESASGGGSTLVILLMLAISVVSLSFSVRRWHDLGKSGWWVCIAIIPVLGMIYAFVMQGFVAGDHSANEYGPAPGQGAMLSPSQTHVVR